MAGSRKKRIWWDDEKRSICLQTAAPGVSVAQVARLLRDKQGENPASIRMRTRVRGLAGRA